MAMGVTLGQVSAGPPGLVPLVGLIPISLSVYMITYSHGIYARLEPWFGASGHNRPYREEKPEQQHFAKGEYDVIPFGLGRYGKAIAHYSQQRELSLLAADFNAEGFDAGVPRAMQLFMWCA